MEELKILSQVLVMLFNIKFGNKALDVKYQFEILVILLSSFTMFWFANALIDASVNIQNAYTKIHSLESQPQTSDVVQQLNETFDTMRANNDSYFFYYDGLLYLSEFTLAYLIKDIQELIYAKIRSIFIQFFSIENLLDLFNAFITFYWMYKHYFKFIEGLNDVRYELRAWTLNNNINSDTYFDINIALASLMG